MGVTTHRFLWNVSQQMKVTMDKSTNYAKRVNDRRLILGQRDNFMAISPMKHKWARDVWKMMLTNTWTPGEVNLADDVICYRDNLTEAERFAYDKALAFLSNLDGIQFHNINMNISSHVTSPEVAMCLSRQAFEEALHVDSYAQMIEAISLDPMSVYMTFERDGILAKKNEFILNQSQVLGLKEFTARGFALALVSNILLEGVYFFSGFLVFYLLARQGKMLGSADMVRFIQRDEEQNHLTLFKHMLETMQIENPEVFDDEFWKDALDIFNTSAQLEITWGKYVFSGGVFGATDLMVENYIKSLCNKRAAYINAPFTPFPGAQNPYEWVERFSAPNGVEKNFFETKVDAYQVGALEW